MGWKAGNLTLLAYLLLPSLLGTSAYGQALRGGNDSLLSTASISEDGVNVVEATKKVTKKIVDTALQTAEASAVIWEYLGLEATGQGDDVEGLSILFNANDKDKAWWDGNQQQQQHHSYRGRVASNLAEMLVGHSKYPFCAWDAQTEESIYTPLLLDPNAVYQPQLLSFASNPNRIYKIKAQFPRVLYMSYQSYTLRGEPLTSIVDYEIEPHWGMNAYRDEGAIPETAGGYEIHVTRRGDRGLPNELRGLSDDEKGDGGQQMRFMTTSNFLGNLSIIILRFYTREPPPSMWGEAGPPVISYSDDDGKTWEALDACNARQRELFNRSLRQLGNVGYLLKDVAALSQSYRVRACPLVEVDQAYVPGFVPSATNTDTNQLGYIPFSNFDSDYSYYCTDGNELGPNFVMILTGTAPTTASGLYDKPYPVADRAAYQLRYWGLAAAELHVPRPTYSSISAHMMETHYGAEWDRKYKVIGARNRDIAKACELDDPSAMFLNFTNPRIPDPPVYPAVIAREQLARHNALHTAKEPGTLDYAIDNCNDKANRCIDPVYLKQQMGDRVPTLQVFKCDIKTGQASPYIYHPTIRDEAANQKVPGSGQLVG